MSTVLPSFFALSPEKVAEVRRDAELRKDNAVYYYVTDVHDLSYFCFPINSRSAEQVNISDVADEQAALFEIFMRRDPKPILVEEYEKELDRNFKSLKQAAELAYDKAEMLKAMARDLDLVPNGSQPDEAVTRLGRDFKVILAVTTGIYSLGLQRWEEIVNGRLLFESKLSGSVPSLLEQAFREYRRSGLYYEIRDTLRARIPRFVSSQSGRYQKERAADNDARVVDKVLQVNHFLENAYQSGRLPHRQIVIYFASARKTHSIFKMASVREALPVIAGAPFSPWRTKTQVFLSLTMRPGLAGEHSVKEKAALVDNLTRFEQLRSDSRIAGHTHIPDKCADCVLNNGQGANCSWVGLCTTITNLSRKYLEEDASMLPNLGLLANIKKYAKFSERHASLDFESGEKVREMFKSLLNDTEVRDITLERLWVLSRRVSLNSILLQTGPPDLSEEVVTSAMQILPFAIQIESEQYRAIVKDLIEYYQMPFNQTQEKQKLLSRVYGAWGALDRMVSRVDPEHELVRSLVYMSFEGTSKRSGRSLDQAKSAFERLRGEKQALRWHAEFGYVLLWALRLHDRHKECHEQGQRLLRQFPDDPRVYHGLLLNGYVWYEKQSKQYTVQSLIDLAFKTKELYIRFMDKYRETLSDQRLIDGLIGVALNDMAYLSCFEEQYEDLATAHKYLDQVTAYVPRGEWPEKFPEYLHTEATIQYVEARSQRSPSKLDEAESNLKLAMKYRNARRFADLEEKIKQLRADLTPR